MRRAHIALLALFFLIVVVAAWAAPAPECRGGPTEASSVCSVALKATGALPAVARTNVRQGIAEPLPATGASVSFNAPFR